MRTEELRRGLAESAREQPAPGSVETVIARGRRRLLRRRIGAGVVVLALVGVSLGVVASTRHSARRGVVIAPAPTSVPRPTLAPTTTGAQVIFTSADEGWICGEPILHTADGGQHWQAESYTQFAKGTATCAAVPTDMWIFVQSPSGAVTVLPAQGGAHIAVTIEFPKLPAGATVAQATFVDRNNGWVLVRPADDAPGHGLLYRTTTGTGPIRFALVSDAAPIGNVQFADANEGWGTDGTEVKHTTDGGATWTAVPVPRPREYGDQTELVDKLAVAGDTIVIEEVAVDGTGPLGRPSFLESGDRGRTWTVFTDPSLSFDTTQPTTLAVVDATHWRFAFGEQLWVIDGAADTARTYALPPGVTSVAFPTPDTGWASTDGGSVLRTTDTGRRWTTVDTTPQPSWDTNLVDVPGNSGGCPAVVAPSSVPGDARISDHDYAVRAAEGFVRATRGWTGEEVDAVYPVPQPGGEFGAVFSSNVPRQCGQAVADASWGVELGNASVSQDNSRTTALVVAPTANGWKVWGFYR